jgi:periplasmic protein TonB
LEIDAPEEVEMPAEQPQPLNAMPDNPPEHVSFKTAFALPQPEPLTPPPPPPRRDEPAVMSGSPAPAPTPKPGTAPFVSRTGRPIAAPIPIAPRIAPRKPQPPPVEKEIAAGEPTAPVDAPKTNGGGDPAVISRETAIDFDRPTAPTTGEQAQTEFAPATPGPAVEAAQPSASLAGEASPAPQSSSGGSPDNPAEGANVEEAAALAKAQPGVEAAAPDDETDSKPEQVRKGRRRSKAAKS